MRFKLQNTGDNWSFDLVSDAGNTLLTGVTLPSQEAAVEAIRNTINATRSADNYRQNAAGTNSTFSLLDNNGNVLGSSTAFASPEGAQTAATNLREDALKTTDFPVDLTSTTTETTTTKRTLNKKLPTPPSLEEMAVFYVVTRSSKSGTAGPELFEEDGKYWYHINNAKGNAILYGRGLESTSKRKTNIRSALRYGTKAKYYDLQESNGQYYFVIRTPNKFEITRSAFFSSETDRQAAIDFLIANAESYKPAFAKETRKAKLNAQEYVFDYASTSGKIGFEEFKNENNKKYYFHLNDDDGTALLYSQGYKGSKPRNTGMRSVIKNGNKKERYRIKQNGGKFHVVLLAGNNQEIARSRPLDNEADGEAIITYLIGLMPGYANQYDVVLVKETKTVTETNTFNIEMGLPTVPKPEPVPSPKKKERKDNYMTCSAYDRDAGKEGFYKFQHEKNQQYFFSYNDKEGNTVWRSEGYTTQAARDNGIESVKKNVVIEGRITTHKTKSGKYFAKVKAGNNQEVARSCYHVEEQDLALSLAGFLQSHGMDANTYLLGLIPAWAGYRSNWTWWKQQEEEKIAMAAAASAEEERLAAELAAKAETERLAAEAKIAEEARLVAEAKAAEEARIAAEMKAKEDAQIAAEKEAEVERLALEAKQAEEAKLAAAALAASQKKEEEERRALALEAEQAEKAKIAAAASQKKKEEEKIALAARKAAEEKEERLALETKQAQEEKAKIAAAAAAAAAALAASQKKEKEEKIAFAAAKAEEERIASEAEQKRKLEERKKTLDVDNYLPCKEYRIGKGYKEFKQNSQYYFTFNDEKGNVIFRSEGYNQVNARNKGRDWVKRQMKDKKNYRTKHTAAGKHYFTLMANEKTEIARSCYYDSEAAMLAAMSAVYAPPVAAAVPVAKPKPKAAPVMAQTGGKAKGAMVVDEVVKESSGRPWWLWLLPLLLLPILWFLFKGCEGCNKKANPPVIEEPAPAPTPEPVDTIQPEPPKPLGQNGTELGFTEGGVAWNLANCLSDPNCTLPAKYTMENTCFPKNGAKLPKAAYPTMADLAKVFKAYPNAKFTIFGNIDKAESETYSGPYQDGNITLSAIRGRCIYKRLIKRGIAANRMQFKGQADTKNIGDACANRRVEIEITER